jgi:hypothetical protein
MSKYLQATTVAILIFICVKIIKTDDAEVLLRSGIFLIHRIFVFQQMIENFFVARWRSVQCYSKLFKVAQIWHMLEKCNKKLANRLQEPQRDCATEFGHTVYKLLTQAIKFFEQNQWLRFARKPWLEWSD